MKVPTARQVLEYARENGYAIDPGVFLDYYQQRDWKDSRGKPVKNWKLKLRAVWFTQDRKLEPCPGAPEGYEYWYVEEGGNIYMPDRWKNGVPYSNEGFIADSILQETYRQEQCTRSK